MFGEGTGETQDQSQKQRARVPAPHKLKHTSQGTQAAVHTLAQRRGGFGYGGTELIDGPGDFFFGDYGGWG